MESNYKTKEEILRSALEARQQEVLHYQINIDNYTIALDKISKMSLQEQQEFKSFNDQISALLITEKLEQKKAKLMLDVIECQLGA